MVVVELAVVRTWKGVDSERVILRTPTDSAACGYRCRSHGPKQTRKGSRCIDRRCYRSRIGCCQRPPSFACLTTLSCSMPCTKDQPTALPAANRRWVRRDTRRSGTSRPARSAS